MVFTGFRFAFLHNDLKLPLIEQVGEEIYDNLRHWRLNQNKNAAIP